MKDQCIEAVTRAAGRALTQQEIRGIEDRITGNMRWLAKQDRQGWAAMSNADRLAKAAKLANEQLIADAVRKKAALIKNAAIVAAAESYFKARAAKGDKHLTALNRMLAPLRDRQGGTEPLSQSIAGIAADLKRNLWEVLDSTGHWGGLFQSRAGLEALIKERFGVDSGNAQAKKASEAWGKAAEAAMAQMNEEGGHIGWLKKYRMPQTHDPMKAWKMGVDRWVEQKLHQVDRSEYVNLDGSMLNDDAMRAVLREAWHAITRDGDEMAVMHATGKRADNGSQHRQIIFKDWESLLQHETELGTGDPVHLMLGHFDRMATDIALIKKFGDNPDNMIAHLAELAYRGDLEAGGNPSETKAARAEALRLYNYIAGKHDPVHSEAVKHLGDVATGIHVASKLGSAVISAINDQATMIMAAQTLKMPVMKLWRNQLSAFNLLKREEKEFARRQGLMHEEMVAGVSRWGTENLAQSGASRLAASVLKLSGLNAFTAAEKRAFGLGMFDLMGKLSREHETMSTLMRGDRETLERMGVTEDVFQVWRKAETVSRDGKGDTVLTPDAIYAVPDVPLAERRNAAQALLGLAINEMDVAVPTPRTRDKFELTGHAPRGTWRGEIWRQMALFKATPYAMLREHWGRMMSEDTGYNSALYAAKFMTLTTLLGAFTLELNEILQGKDPKNFAANPVRTGFAALLKGGGLGFFGDFMFSDKTLLGQSGALAGATGPSGSALESLLRLTVGNSAKAFQGKQTSVASDAADLTKSMLPGANLWYLKAAFNHLWMHYLQDVLQPGYSARLEAKAMREFGQQFWWRPGELMPSRAPDLGAAAR